MFHNILNIYDNEISKNTKNKGKVYQFEKNKMQNIELIYNELQNINYKIKKYNIFLIQDPKYRIVMSLPLRDKVINHYITRYVLIPKLTKYLDDRNVATRKHMGTKAGIDFVKKYLEQHKKYETFYILKIDISKYFYSIDHKVLKDMIKKDLTDFEYHIVCSIIDSTNETYINETILKLKQKELNKKRQEEIERIPFYELEKGLPIGNMTSQFLSIFYLNRVDHMIIHDLHIKHYVRYMDDFILIHKKKDYLEYCLEEIRKTLEQTYALKLNQKKTKIYHSKEGFEFLGYHFQIRNKKTVITLPKDRIKRMKKRIKKVNYLYRNNKISFECAFSSMNHYWYCYQGSILKIRRLIDRYWFKGK